MTLREEKWTRTTWGGTEPVTATAIVLVEDNGTVQVDAGALAQLLWDAGWRPVPKVEAEDL